MQRVLLHNDGKGGRRDDVAVSGGPRGIHVVVDRAGGEDRARELAHLLSPDEVGGCRREGAALEFGVHWHGSILASRFGGLPGNAEPRAPISVSGVLLGVLKSVKRLLAAVALQKIHRVDGNCVAADVVFVVHFDPPSVSITGVLC